MEMRKYCSNCVIKCAKDGLFVKEQFMCKKGEKCSFCGGIEK